MPLDHYVPQVHLRNWLLPGIRRLRVMRKSDLKSFTPRPKAVCAIQDGSTNRYLADDRMIEGFLKEFEPRYNDAVANISSGHIDHESIRTIAGLVSCISSCSPTAMRLHSPSLKELVKTTTNILDRKGMVPKLHGVGLPELLKNGFAEIRIDGKYPQAFGIQNIDKTTAILGNCEWDVVHNEFSDSPFFTSDYPIALEPSEKYSNINNKIIPLTPEIAVRIKPDPSVKNSKAVSTIKARTYKATWVEIRTINRMIVQSAEDLVFYRDEHEWVRTFIEKNRHYRIESVVYKNAFDKGDVVISKQQIVVFVHGKGKEEPPRGDHWFEVGTARDA